jgi:hypothetical protein
VLRAAAAVLTALAVAPRGELAAQAETSRGRRAQPPQRRERPTRNGDIVIPFTIGPQPCLDRTRLYTVSMRIHNVLAQPIGLPTMAAEVSPAPPGSAERPLSNLRLPCGRYLARWTGRHVTTGRRMPPGIYVTELVIDGQRISRKVTLDR